MNDCNFSESGLTVGELLSVGAEKIKKTLDGCETAFLDASLLLAFVLGTERSGLIMRRAEIPGEPAQERYAKLIGRRCTGEPVAYLTGKKSFWLYDFYVTPDVLIPKPDTELLVEKALEAVTAALQGKPDSGYPDAGGGKCFTVADICTGSGCVGLSLLADFNGNPAAARRLRLAAADISEAALAVARTNAETVLNAETRSCLRFIRADLLDLPPKTAAECGAPFDLIVSNPPYVPSGTARELLADGRKEPLLALDGGADGLDLIRRLVPQSFAALKEGGVLLLESGEYNAAETRELLRQNGFCGVETFNDLAGMPRVTRGSKP